MEAGPIFTDQFYSDGRGPELQRVHWALDGQVLRAIDFTNPDETQMRHVFFQSVQVFMFTPEEVISYLSLDPVWSTFRRAGIVCLGKSPWLQSFAPHHLSNCDHYQLMFYDEMVDVICEQLVVREGRYQTGDPSSQLRA